MVNGFKIFVVIATKTIVTLLVTMLLCAVLLASLFIFALEKPAKLSNISSLAELGQSTWDEYCGTIDDIWGNTEEVIQDIRSK